MGQYQDEVQWEASLYLNNPAYRRRSISFETSEFVWHPDISPHLLFIGRLTPKGWLNIQQNKAKMEPGIESLKSIVDDQVLHIIRDSQNNKINSIT